MTAFYRLKVLTPAGKDYGNIELPFSDIWKVQEIKARVIGPDGEVRDFRGPVYEKTLLRAGRVRLLVEAFSLPDVAVGSIIDYRYALKLDLKKAARAGSLSLEPGKPEEGGLPVDWPLLCMPVERWDFDAPLYTYKIHYTFIPFRKGLIAGGGLNMRLAWVSHGLTWSPTDLIGNRIELELGNIPARENEEFMPPEEGMGILFFFLDNSLAGVTDYWARETANWRKAATEFMIPREAVAAESRRLVSGLTSPTEKLKVLYEAAQRIRNLSYEEGLTPSKRMELKLEDNRSVHDVFKRGEGLRSDITRTFVAMARVAGFSADLARVVSRDDKFFRENLLNFYWQFDREVAIVSVENHQLFLDPATPGCPMGLLPWPCTDTTYIRSSGPPGRFETSPLDPPEATLVRREFVLRLDPEGGLSGTVEVVATGQKALEWRLDHLGTDEIEVRRDLEAEMRRLLPENARVSLRKAENMANSEREVRAWFDIELPAAATEAGSRLLLPELRHARRVNPVYFPYLSRESDEILISLPPGMRAETAPDDARSQRSFADYSLVASVDGTEIHVKREFAILKNQLPASQYPYLKTFFDHVREGDEGQIVISPAK